MPRQPRTAAAFTLLEVLVAASILSIATIGVIHAITAGQARTLDALTRGRANTLAEVLLEEVVSKDYADPDGGPGIGTDAGESSRALYDDVDDYHGYSQPAGMLTDHAGVAYPDAYQRFSRSVSVVTQTSSVAALGGDHDGKQVVVTVSEPGGRAWVVERFVPEP